MRSYLVLPALLLAVTFAPAEAGPTARTPDGGMLLAQARPIPPDTDASKSSANPSRSVAGKSSMKKTKKAKSKKTAKKSKIKKARRT
jgi:hypothetical protein